MALAIDLPTETILHIFSYVSPGDIENLSSVCKRYYDVAQKILEEHRRLKNVYGDVTKNLKLSTIVHLIRNPHLTWYVRHLDYISTSWPYYPAPPDEYTKVTQSCPILEDIGRAFWVRATQRREGWPVYMVFVEMCRNVNSISISDRDHLGKPLITCFRNFLRKIAKSPEGMQSQYFTSPTNVIVKIEYPSMYFGNGTGNRLNIRDIDFDTFDSFQAFRTLPALSRLRITIGRGSPFDGLYYEWTSTPHSSVMDVRLTLTARELRDLVRNARDIRYFRIGDSRSRLYDGFRVADIENMLLQHRNSLETLRLCPMRETESITSLNKFRHLKTLTIDISQLWKWDTAAVNRNLRRVTDNHGQFLRLDNVLPKSLENLRVGRAFPDSNILPLDGFVRELLKMVKCKKDTRLALRGICIGAIPSPSGRWCLNWDDYRHMNRLRTACTYGKVLLTTRTDYCGVCTAPETYNHLPKCAVLPYCLL